VLMLVLELRLVVTVRAMVRDSKGTKHLDGKGRGMSVSSNSNCEQC